MKRVFVFGTLKEGFPNFSTNKGSRFRGDFETVQFFPLYLVGERYSPWLVLSPGEGHPVQGQVFDVTDEVLAEMDQLERIEEPDGYRRLEISVRCKTSGDTFSVYAYGKPPSQLADADIRRELQGSYSLADAALYRSRSS